MPYDSPYFADKQQSVSMKISSGNFFPLLRVKGEIIILIEFKLGPQTSPGSQVCSFWKLGTGLTMASSSFSSVCTVLVFVSVLSAIFLGI
jgi:hypothetical protein